MKPRTDANPPRPGFGDRPDPNAGRPQPWFVGSGRGLMIGVVSLVAVLLLVRLVTTIWLAEEAWRWWTTPAPLGAPAASDGIEALPPPPVPPADPRLARTGPRGNPGAAFDAEAYPAESIRANEQGRTVARLRIGPNGAVVRCAVVTSSGFGRLDRRTCEVALRRLRFRPARDEEGRPIESGYTLPVRWQLPPD